MEPSEFIIKIRNDGTLDNNTLSIILYNLSEKIRKGQYAPSEILEDLDGTIVGAMRKKRIRKKEPL